MWRSSLRNSLLTLVEESAELRQRFRSSRVHPIHSVESPHIEMVQVGVSRRLRIIHHKPKKNVKTSNCDGDGTLVGVDEKLSFNDKVDEWAEIIIKKAIKEAFTYLTYETNCYSHQNGFSGIINPCFVEDTCDRGTRSDTSDVIPSHICEEGQSVSESSLCSTWGSNMTDSVRFQRLNTAFSDEKPLIFFIHGVGTSADVWTKQMTYFQERGYETVAVDLIGHGYSSAPYKLKFYKFKRILADILIIFDKYSLQRNVIVGHSYGSSLASALAQQRPSKVCHLILMSGGGPVGLKRRETGFTCLKCLKICVQPLDYCGLYSRELFYCPSSREISIPRTFEVPSYVIHNFAYGQSWPDGNLSFYRSIKIPTLLIYGLRDPHVTLVEECEMEKAIPRSVLELIPNASHMIMLDESNRVNRLLYHFVR